MEEEQSDEQLAKFKEKEEREKKELEEVKNKLKEKGSQKLTLAEYEALQKREASKKRLKVPVHLQFILGTPFLIIFCFGIFFVPFMLFKIATGKPAEKKSEKYTIEQLKKRTASQKSGDTARR